MKRIILLASLCAFALAGCTKEVVDEKKNVDKNAESITILGTLDGSDATRIEVGEYTPGAASVPLLWTSDDVITVAAFDADMMPIMVQGDYFDYELLNEFIATTTSPATATNFAFNGDYFEPFTLPEDATEVLFSAIARPKFSIQGSTSELMAGYPLFGRVLNPIVRDQSYDTRANKATDFMFLTAFKSVSGDELKEPISLQFSNAFATLMLGLEGSAKVDSVVVTVPNAALTYPENTVIANVLAAPTPGSSANGLLMSQGGSFLVDLDMNTYELIPASESVRLNFTSPCSLNSEIQWFPVSVMPFATQNVTIKIDIYGTSQTGEKKSVTKTVTIPAGTPDITTNSIAYISMKDIKAEELGQQAPKSDWAAGDVVFEDDFKWISDSWNSELDPYGFNNPYNNLLFPKYNYYGVSSALTGRGYFTEGYNLNGLHSYEGMLQIGDKDQNSALIVPLTPLYSYKGDIAVTFRAVPYTTSFGTGSTSEWDPWDGLAVVKASSNGTILKEVTLGEGAEPFTWYEYTLVIEDVDANTQLMFGSDNQNYEAPKHIFFLDDLRISILDGETENIAGTKIAAGAPELQFVAPAMTGDKVSIEVPAVKETGDAYGNINEADLPNFKFSVTGPWELVVPEGTDTWLKVSAPQWSDWEDKRPNKMIDEFGNQMTSVCTIQVMEDNDTGATRTAAIQLKSGNTVLTTFEISQPAAAPKTEIYNADFGPRPDADFDVTDQLTAAQWGIGSYELSFIDLAYDANGANPGLQISRSGVSKDYENASGNGNLYFINSVPVEGVAELDPSFVINIPAATITGASYLYVNFGAWGRANYDKGTLRCDVEYSDGTTQEITVSLQTAGTWQYFENRLEVPANITSAKVKFYAKDASNAWTGGTVSAAANYRIDDVNIAVRAN